MLSTRTSLTSLALLLAIAAPACGSDNNAAPSTPGATPTDPDGGVADTPKANPVPGTPTEDTITEEHGIFVAPSGNDAADGSRAHPLATVQAGITSATRVGKIVFVCTGTYAEAITIADSISIIGGLTCTDPTHWQTGGAPSKINAPTSPAAIAKSVAAPTRLEALEIVAPNATDAGASSIGFLADHSPGLTIVSSKITAGSGANGKNGDEGIQLAESANAAGRESRPSFACPAGQNNACHNFVTHDFQNPPGAVGGDGTCTGAPNHNAGNGAAGGAGGLYQAEPASGLFGNRWDRYQNNPAFDGSQPGLPGSGAIGTDGGNGAPAADFGTFTVEGYVAPNGNPGTDGTIGFGGYGGTGGNSNDVGTPTPTQISNAEIRAGLGGAGGGAGGCPGLAGTAGSGGGASIGIALIESPVVLEGTTINAATGGSGGLGTFGSNATLGGAPGPNFSTVATSTAGHGGRGGFSGFSTNGANGPSIAMLISGAAPMRKGTTTATPGPAAPAIEARTSAGAGGNPQKTIPATPAGLAVESKTLGN